MQLYQCNYINYQVYQCEAFGDDKMDTSFDKTDSQNEEAKLTKSWTKIHVHFVIRLIRSIPQILLSANRKRWDLELNLAAAKL